VAIRIGIAAGRGGVSCSRRVWGRIGRSLLLAAAMAVVTAGAASGAASVVGGDPVQIQAAPWSVALEVQAPTWTSLCTGSILNASLIVTAAHCLFDAAGALADPSQLSVEAGTSNFVRPVGTDAEQERTVESFAIDPGYAWTGQVMPDDVAVLALSSPLDLTGPAVHAVALPAPNGLFPAGAAVGLAGFGEETPGIFPTGPLDSMTATIDAQGSCGATSGGGVLADDTIRLCASAPDSAACNGDSGAGLVTTGASPTLVGVVSGAPSGCVAGSHTIYTYVGAAEILGFLQRYADPPAALPPGALSPAGLGWSGLDVGARLTCSAGGWSGPPVTLSYSFITGSGRVLAAGARKSYTLRAADAGTTVSCRVAARNNSGTAVEHSAATPIIEPAFAAVGSVGRQRAAPQRSRNLDSRSR
jgi:hypothetical protein